MNKEDKGQNFELFPCFRGKRLGNINIVKTHCESCRPSNQIFTSLWRTSAAACLYFHENVRIWTWIDLHHPHEDTVAKTWGQSNVVLVINTVNICLKTCAQWKSRVIRDVQCINNVQFIKISYMLVEEFLQTIDQSNKYPNLYVRDHLSMPRFWSSSLLFSVTSVSR